MITLTRRAQTFNGEFIRVADSWQEKLVKAGIKQDLYWRELDTGTIVATGGKTRSINRCYRIELDSGEIIYFKRYLYLKPKPQFWMMPSKAAIEVWGYNLLRKMGLETPEVIAYGEHRRLGHLHAAFVVTKEVINTVDMEKFAHDTWYFLPKPEQDRIYRQLSQQIMHIAQTMHAHNFYHHDFKWRNILVQKNGDDYKAILIDGPRASIKHLRKARGELVDIAGLARIAKFYLRRTEQLRWLRDFCGDSDKAKILFRKIQKYMSTREPVDPRPTSSAIDP